MREVEDRLLFRQLLALRAGTARARCRMEGCGLGNGEWPSSADAGNALPLREEERALAPGASRCCPLLNFAGCRAASLR